MKQVIIYTDGACRGNPGPGGWGALIQYEGTEKEVYGGLEETTNNQMELSAAIQGLKALNESCHVDLFTDSKYVMDGITNWIHNWKKNNWKTAAKKEVKPVASAETAKPEPKKVTEEPASQSTSSADIQIEDLIDMPDEPEPVPEEIKVEQKESPAAAPVKAEPDNVEEGQEEAHGEASFSVEDLAAKWKRCCELVSKENIALPLVLNKAKPLKVKGSIVEIGFEHRFHYDTMQQAKNSDMLMRAINEVMQKSVSLEMVYMEQNVDDTVDELVEAFGGSVVA